MDGLLLFFLHIPVRENNFQNLVCMIHCTEVQLPANKRINLLQVGLIFLWDDDGSNSRPKCGHRLFTQAADGQHPAAQADLTGHRDITTDRFTAQR